MRYYSGMGDNGFTTLSTKRKVIKSDPIIEFLGTIDELSSYLGLARSICKSPDIQEIILRIQRDLSVLMAEVSSAQGKDLENNSFNDGYVNCLEEQLKIIGKKVVVPQDFIIPGDTQAAAVIDICRTIARRAERRFVTLSKKSEHANPQILRYLNRLSSLIFILELYELHTSGIHYPTLMNEAGK
jgi:cob(I)alamin adenosyltransferase